LKGDISAKNVILSHIRFLTCHMNRFDAFRMI
jgi:hypothetical protein